MEGVKEPKFYLDQMSTASVRILGNTNNTIAGLQKKLGFVDKIKQLHTYFSTDLNGAAKMSRM